MAHTVWIGTYTREGSLGIYRAGFDDGAIRVRGAVPADNPSYLAADGACLYAVAETTNGGICSYRIGSDQGLRLTGSQRVLGDGPCHVCLDGLYVYVSNYDSGYLSVFELDKEGAIHAPPRVVAHTGVNRGAAQEPAHAHQAVVTPDGAFVAICDLGLNGVVFYPRDPQCGIREPGSWVYAAEGAGPRHAVFGEDKFWYVVCELSCEVLTYCGYGSSAWLLQRQSLIHAGQENASAAAIHLSPDRALLLASVRGSDELVLFDVLPDGRLSPPQRFYAGGSWPRDAVFSPDGRFVLCACERDNRVTVFRVHNGGLRPIGSASVPSPVCLCFESAAN